MKTQRCCYNKRDRRQLSFEFMILYTKRRQLWFEGMQVKLNKRQMSLFWRGKNFKKYLMKSKLALQKNKQRTDKLMCLKQITMINLCENWLFVCVFLCSVFVVCGFVFFCAGMNVFRVIHASWSVDRCRLDMCSIAGLATDVVSHAHNVERWRCGIYMKTETATDVVSHACWSRGGGRWRLHV